MAFNPFTHLPTGLCDDMPLPDFPKEQDCTSYGQELSEVCGLIVVPEGLEPPNNWHDFDEWYGLFANKINNTNPAKAHYIVGKGSFLPTEKSIMTLAGGRVQENRERTYRLEMSVLNMDPGHVSFARQLMSNKKDFTFFLHTVSDKVIGIDGGLMPVYVDADVPFASEGATERISLTIDTDFFSFPEW